MRATLNNVSSDIDLGQMRAEQPRAFCKVVLLRLPFSGCVLCNHAGTGARLLHTVALIKNNVFHSSAAMQFHTTLDFAQSNASKLMIRLSHTRRSMVSICALNECVMHLIH